MFVKGTFSSYFWLRKVGTVNQGTYKATIIAEHDSNDDGTFDTEFGRLDIEIKFVSPYKPTDYYYTLGDEQKVEYDPKTTDGALFRIDADYNLFEEGGEVYVDDELVDPSDYTSREGSTVIVLHNSLLDTLEDGLHYLDVLFNDGNYASTTFTIERVNTTTDEEDDDDNEITIDDNNQTNNNENSSEELITPPKTGIDYIEKEDDSLAIISVIVLMVTSFVLTKKFN